MNENNGNAPVQQSTHTTSGIDTKFIVCGKCGATYSSSQRYCMKCGNLNFDHPSNQSMKQFLTKNAMENGNEYTNEGSANFTDNSNINYTNVVSDNGSKKGNDKRNCIIGNIIIHGILAVFIVLLLMSDAPVYVGILVFLCMGMMFLYNCSTSLIYIKAGEPWWFWFIPVLNIFSFFKISMGNGFWFLAWLFGTIGIMVIVIITAFLNPILSFLAGVGLYVFTAIPLYKLGKKFDYNGFLTAIFPFIMLPIIAFSNKGEYTGTLGNTELSLGDDTLDKHGRTKSEAEYRKRKGATVFGVLLVVAVIIFLTYPYVIEYGGDLLDKIVEIYNQFIEIIGSMN